MNSQSKSTYSCLVLFSLLSLIVTQKTALATLQAKGLPDPQIKDVSWSWKPFGDGVRIEVTSLSWSMLSAFEAGCYRLLYVVRGIWIMALPSVSPSLFIHVHEGSMRQLGTDGIDPVLYWSMDPKRCWRSLWQLPILNFIFPSSSFEEVSMELIDSKSNNIGSPLKRTMLGKILGKSRPTWLSLPKSEKGISGFLWEILGKQISVLLTLSMCIDGAFRTRFSLNFQWKFIP